MVKQYVFIYDTVKILTSCVFRKHPHQLRCSAPWRRLHTWIRISPRPNLCPRRSLPDTSR